MSVFPVLSIPGIPILTTKMTQAAMWQVVVLLAFTAKATENGRKLPGGFYFARTSQYVDNCTKKTGPLWSDNSIIYKMQYFKKLMHEIFRSIRVSMIFVHSVRFLESMSSFSPQPPQLGLATSLAPGAKDPPSNLTASWPPPHLLELKPRSQRAPQLRETISKKTSPERKGSPRKANLESLKRKKNFKKTRI